MPQPWPLALVAAVLVQILAAAGWASLILLGLAGLWRARRGLLLALWFWCAGCLVALSWLATSMRLFG